MEKWSGALSDQIKSIPDCQRNVLLALVHEGGNMPAGVKRGSDSLPKAEIGDCMFRSELVAGSRLIFRRCFADLTGKRSVA